jgi:hypothetical protein
VSLDTVLSDPAGLHMNSGHIFAIYALKPTPDQESTDSLKSKLPTQLEVSTSYFLFTHQEASRKNVLLIIYHIRTCV